jgi:aminopeptidase N
MDLDLNLNEKVKTLTGTAILKIKPYFYAIDSLVLDAQYMDIFNVSILDSALKLGYEYDSTRLTVFF